jgi:hypothetical protein
MIEQDVRVALRKRADLVEPYAVSGAELRSRAATHRRHTTRRRLGAAVTAVAALAAVLAAPRLLHHGSLPPAAGTVTTWPARGNLAADAKLTAAARAAWEAAPVLKAELPHRDVQVVLAARTPFGRYVMLTGVNALGHPRLAVLSDDPRDHPPYANRLRLRSDRAFPADDELLTYLEQRHVNGQPRALLLVAGPPEVTRLRWRDQFKTWRDLPATTGVAAAVVDTDYPDLHVRAYRETRRIAQQPAAPHLPRDVLYEPDETLSPPESQDDDCHGGVCTTTSGGGVSIGLPQPGELAGVQRPESERWEDMSDQAQQLWLNWALGARRRTSSGGGGLHLSTLLPSGTGVALTIRSVNDSDDHLVLYVDRPEWPVGQLYLAKPIDPNHPVRAVTALVPGGDTPYGNGSTLVAFAGTGVTVRYRIQAGPWRPITVHDGIGTATILGDGFGANAIEIETTFEGHRQTGPLDTFFEVLN